MRDSILIAYSSRHGSTRQVADAVAAALEEHGEGAEVRAAASVQDPSEYAAVIVGAPIYVGRWHRDGRSFLRRHREALGRVPLAVFATGPVSDKPEDWIVARAQLARALAAFPELRPVDVRVFGGSVDPSQLHFPLSKMPAADLRDWSEIRHWAAGLADVFEHSKARAGAPR